MTPAAKLELKRLEAQDDRDRRMIARAVENQTIAYREEISRMRAEHAETAKKLAIVLSRANRAILSLGTPHEAETLREFAAFLDSLS